MVGVECVVLGSRCKMESGQKEEGWGDRVSNQEEDDIRQAGGKLCFV